VQLLGCSPQHATQLGSEQMCFTTASSICDICELSRALAGLVVVKNVKTKRATTLAVRLAKPIVFIRTSRK
jgi:hypothetical protein